MSARRKASDGFDILFLGVPLLFFVASSRSKKRKKAVATRTVSSGGSGSAGDPKWRIRYVPHLEIYTVEIYSGTGWLTLKDSFSGMVMGFKLESEAMVLVDKLHSGELIVDEQGLAEPAQLDY